MTRYIFLCLITGMIIFIVACKKQEVSDQDTKMKTFDVSIEISDLTYFPGDSISMTFSVKANDGTPPYKYYWHTPDTLSGSGPYTIQLKKDFTADLTVKDVNNTTVDFQYTLLKDTIDSLKYDYRNPYLGLYKCKVKYCDYNSYDTVYCTIGKDTLLVSKEDVHTDFTQLYTSVARVDFNFKTLSFSGYHTCGYFYGDSIYVYTYLTPIALYTYEYWGSKIDTPTSKYPRTKRILYPD